MEKQIFIRFQDTPDFSDDYRSCHNTFIVGYEDEEGNYIDVNDVCRDREIEALGLYADEDSYDLKKGLVFAFLPINDEADDVNSWNSGQAADGSYKIVIETDWWVAVGGGHDGYIIDLNKSTILSVQKKVK